MLATWPWGKVARPRSARASGSSFPAGVDAFAMPTWLHMDTSAMGSVCVLQSYDFSTTEARQDYTGLYRDYIGDYIELIQRIIQVLYRGLYGAYIDDYTEII